MSSPRLLFGSRAHEEGRSHHLRAAAHRQYQPESARRAVDILLAGARALSVTRVAVPRHRPQLGTGCERYASRERRDRAAILAEIELVEHRLPAGAGLLLDPAAPFERRPGRRGLDRESAGLRKIAELRGGGLRNCRKAQCHGDPYETSDHTRTSKSCHTLLSLRHGFPTGSSPSGGGKYSGTMALHPRTEVSVRMSLKRLSVGLPSMTWLRAEPWPPAMGVTNHPLRGLAKLCGRKRACQRTFQEKLFK